MNYTLLFYCFFCSLLACTSVRSQPEPQSQSTLPGLDGRWRWERSSFQTRGMREPQVTTPASTGVDMELEFVNDHSINIYHNKQLKGSSNYRAYLMEDTPIWMFESENRSIEPGVENGPIQVQADSIVIYGGANDAGSTQIWRRIKK